MDIAIVTGAETPLGLRIIQTLVQQGYRVHGIGNNFSKVTYGDPQFKAHAIDLSDLDTVASALGRILDDEQRLDLLVQAIDVTPGTSFEKLPAGNLEAILKIGLLGPVMMTRLALPNLLRFRGQLINVVTANKHGHPASAANALIEGGLREMNRALFDRSRDAGLRVTNCMLRQNTEICDGSVSDDALAQSHISLDDVARAIEQLIDPNTVNVPGEIVLYPRISSAAREALPETPLPLDPYSAVVLPPKAYRPPEEAKIPTQQKQPVERTIPYSDEEMEDKIAAAIEDFEAHPERYDRPDPAPIKQQQGGPKRNNSPQNGPQQEGQGKNKRRRRGGRNRNKKPQDGDGPKRENTVAPQQQKEAESQAPPKKPGPEPSVKDKSAAEPKPKEADESLRQNPEAGSKKKTVLKPDKASPDAAAKAPASPAPGKDLTRKPVKKAAKKAAKKTAKKKTAAKKAAKKKTVKKKAVQKVAE